MRFNIPSAAVLSMVSRTSPLPSHHPGPCPGRRVVPYPRTWPMWVRLLGAPLPLLAQEVLELVHQLLRVEVVVPR